MGLSLPLLEYHLESMDNPFCESLLEGKPVVDVRAPVEFAEGNIPGSINLPILNDDERHEIGICYKNLGSAAAIARGYELVSGKNKERKLAAWTQFLRQNPHSFITCFRGGQRSQISQKWLDEVGFHVLRLDGGYKKARKFFIQSIDSFCKTFQLVVVSGKTGSHKTKLIHELSPLKCTLDLEKIACHRGSAFGQMDQPQPSQAQFENELAVEMLRLVRSSHHHPFICIEDESRMIGKLTQPQVLFELLRNSPVAMLDEPLSVRVQNIFETYILHSKIGKFLEEPTDIEPALATFKSFQQSVHSISKKLGGEKTSLVLGLLEQAKKDFESSGQLELNCVWIQELLESYYDPLYLKSLEKRNPQEKFRGTYFEVLNWFENKINKLPDVSKNEM
ncbi:MAG: tRNA 2-selenouridine(34) synthase MnmH [Pseudobdellovibrionaceae bacterium]